MLGLLAISMARGGDPQILDAADARYHAASGRAAAAARWYRDRMEAEPAELDWVIGWLDTLGGLPAARHPDLLGEVEAWLAAHPDLERRGAALARAHALHDVGPFTLADDSPGNPRRAGFEAPVRSG